MPCRFSPSPKPDAHRQVVDTVAVEVPRSQIEAELVAFLRRRGKKVDVLMERGRIRAGQALIRTPQNIDRAGIV